MKPEKILIVDDDKELLHLMTIAMKRSGYQVEAANGGIAALQMLQNGGSFALLLTDLMMPDLSGLDLLRQARQNDCFLEVIVITASDTFDTAVTAMRAGGAFDYLLKPLDSISHLTLAVDRAIAHRRLLLEREELQAQVQAEAQRLQTLISNTGDAILSGSASGELTHINPAATRLFNKNNPAEQASTFSLPAILSTILSNWQTIGGRFPATIEIPWEDGSIQMVSLAPIRGPKNEDQGWVMVLRDITHLRKLDELKARMLNEAANKIRVPLADAMSTLVKLNRFAVQEDRFTEEVFHLTTVWKLIQDWADNLVSLANLDSDRNVKASRVNLLQILEELRQELEAGMFGPLGLRFKLTTSPDLPDVRADTDLLRQLLYELLKRASLRSERNGEIRLHAQENQDQVWIDVSDDGPAILTTDLPYVFKKPSIRLKTGSLNANIDLGVVKTILDRMGGQVWIGGQGPKQGTVTICLPRATTRFKANAMD